MTIGNYCQITGRKSRPHEVKAEVHGIVVTAPALMNKVYGDPPTPRDQVRAMVRYCAVCGAEQPDPLREHCVACESPMFTEVGDKDLSNKGAPAVIGTRIYAFLVDLILIAALAAGVVYAIGLAQENLIKTGEAASGELSPEKLFTMIKYISAALVFILYHALFTAISGATPGKLALGIRVMLKNGSAKIPFGKSIVRSALYLFSIYVIPIGLLPLVFQEPPGKWLSIIEADALFHDILTDTAVIKPNS